MSFVYHLKNKLLAHNRYIYYYRFVVFKKNNILKLLKYRFFHINTKNVFYLYFDPSLSHPGLADRLKAILCCYYIAKSNNYSFRIVFERPFLLKDYLVPNEVNWFAEEKELEYSFFDTRIMSYWGQFKILKPNKKYICYNYLDDIMPELKKNHSIWEDLFNKLFTPSKKLNEMMMETGLKYHQYIAIHLRFVNALGEFEKGAHPLSKGDQNKLVDRCRCCIEKICKVEDYPLVVFSDSSYFLRCITDLPVKILGGSNISHIKYTEKEDDILKTFFDFLMIQRSNKVYRIIAPEMFRSNFSAIAAKTGGIIIEDINV